MNAIKYLRGAANGTATPGEPGAEGRWQPTRAGIVNSWAWAREEFLFADGWLALVGPNGSGKSLSASMLITVLLDADTSQTALSVSGKAAGTLTSRHTDWNDREDRTGSWWLEYGRRDPETGHTTYVTTGLWLRATAGHLHRAFFIAPGRVGDGLLLEHDREPVHIEALAEQLAACDGELFTESAILHTKALKSFAAVRDERAYRQTVRTRLFAPLTEVQFDALLAVLRSLRSLRTAEAISPKRMRQVLTDALPALNTENLHQIAEAMERIAALETQLTRTREEAKLLEATDRNWRRYQTAVAQVEAAALTAANTDFDNQARSTRDATAQVEAATAAQTDADQLHTHTLGEIAQIEGRLDAADSLLRDHAGADLPHKELRAKELNDRADEAADRAGQTAEDAEAAAEISLGSTDIARDAQQHVGRLAEALRTSTPALEAEAAFERLLSATHRLVEVLPDAAADIDIDIDQLCATPLAWAETRTRQLDEVNEALQAHQRAQDAEHQVAQERRAAETEEDARRTDAQHATADRQRTEQRLLERLYAWNAQAPHLGPFPSELATCDDSRANRIDPGRFGDWLTTTAATTRARIDLPRHQQKAFTDAALARAADENVATARADHATAQVVLAQATTVLDGVRERARVAAEDDELLRAHALHVHELAVAAAQAALAVAQQHLVDREAEAERATLAWIDDLHQWRSRLVHLDARDVALPDTHGAAVRLASLQPSEIELSVERAHALAAGRLQREVDTAHRQVTEATEAVAAAESALEESRRGAPIPSAPPWRTRSPQDGTPLWALVGFAPGLPASDADRLEGALLVSGLLDALVTPDGRLVAGDLAFTTDAPAAPGRTLADLLTVEADPAVAPARVHALLAAIAVDSSSTGPITGRLAAGVLTASAPAGYEAAFIGHTARERARLAKVARLEQDLANARGHLEQAEEELVCRQGDLASAAAERDRFPPPAPLHSARDQADRAQHDAVTAQRQSASCIAQAQLDLNATLTGLDTAAAARTAHLESAVRDQFHAQQDVALKAARLGDAEQTADKRSATAQHSENVRQEASDAQSEADTEQDSFPHRESDAVRTAQQEEDDAEQHLTHARATVIKVTERHQDASSAVKAGLRALNRSATLPSGGLLPTGPQPLRRYRDAVTQVAQHAQAWGNAALRAVDLLGRAGQDTRQADHRARLCAAARQEADRAQLLADRESAAVAEIRALYGSEYQQLLEHRDTTADALKEFRDQAEHLVRERQSAAEQAAAARAVLAGITPLREAAEARRDGCLRRFGQLVDERLATVPDGLPIDARGRPANLTAGLAWARRLLSDAPGGTDRLTVLTQHRSRLLTTLETSARVASTALARFDRQVTLLSIEDTDWRRAVVADPAATRGEDVHASIQALEATATQLDDDLRADIKRTLKTSLFTRLQSDIQLRRVAAQELVRKIRATLGDVRTGVAGVGVQVDWDVRDDEDAQRMVQLIQQPANDDTFDQMYAMLRKRMDEKAGEPWADRVAHTFDYRAWHDWKISITHSSFAAAGKDKFREVTVRSNPLEALSTGERRLATMLPLLAAAWSMYSGDYQGPRLLSIDEIDAAFDEANLRQVLALLRSWQFDVLATAPFMTPMIKTEAQHVMVHQVVTAGRHRVTVPWLWQGHGEPQPLTLDLALDQAGGGR